MFYCTFMNHMVHMIWSRCSIVLLGRWRGSHSCSGHVWFMWVKSFEEKLVVELRWGRRMMISLFVACLWKSVLSWYSDSNRPWKTLVRSGGFLALPPMQIHWGNFFSLSLKMELRLLRHLFQQISMTHGLQGFGATSLQRSSLKSFTLWRSHRSLCHWRSAEGSTSVVK